uniref:m7GpppN-mRNA hydrolase n=1 Tax=Anopheles maculatus TaxID=74869 RepID=A0A182SYP9_9DIPT
MATNSPLSVAQPATASGQKGKQNNGMLAISSDIMDDLASRFIINVPEEERKNLIRICFQMELAHWFYLDFYCGESKHKCGIKQFAQQMFKHVPFLQPHWPTVDAVLEDWKQYKLTVPTYGAILLSEDMKHVLLVQSFWAKSSWGFPKGKINENEEPVNCAIREVYEETGYDIRKLIVPTEYIDVIINYQFTRLYLVPGVPLTTVFVPKTRNEIKCCEWFPVDVLPVTKHDNIVKDNHSLSGNSFFMILPFVKRLKKWLESYHSGKPAGKGAIGKGATNHHLPSNSPVFGRDSTGKQQQQGQKQRQRHKSMGELEQQPPIQILQRNKGNAAGTPNVYQHQSVPTHTSANRPQQQQQQQKQTARDDSNRSQRAASVANESYNEFRFGIGEGSSASSKPLQMASAAQTSEPKSGPSHSAADSRTERVVNSQTKRKLFANCLGSQTQAAGNVEKVGTHDETNGEADEEMDEILDWLAKEGRTDHFMIGVRQWTDWALDWGPFVHPDLYRKLGIIE